MTHALESLMERQEFPAGALYVVATPIGNLGDISLRALYVLRRMDAVAAEDTRTSRPLLHAYGIEPKRWISAHEHNEREAAEQIVLSLQAGERIALITDAGTPAISDPGARLVQTVRAAGLRVVPIPGATSIATALSACGLVSEGGRFYFGGFLPTKSAQRQTVLKAAAEVPATLVFLESPHRIAECVADIAQVLDADRTLTFARELTKRFEQVETVRIDAASAWLAGDADRSRGEFVLMISAPLPAQTEDGLSPQAQNILDVLLAELPVKQAVALAAKLTDSPRNALYAEALRRKQASEAS